MTSNLQPIVRNMQILVCDISFIIDGHSCAESTPLLCQKQPDRIGDLGELQERLAGDLKLLETTVSLVEQDTSRDPK